MKTKKNLLSLIIALCLCMALAALALAAHYDNLFNHKTVEPVFNKDGSITFSLQPDYDNFKDKVIEVHGQIEFDDAYMTMPLHDDFNSEDISNEELEDILQPYLEAGKTVRAIGWTKAYIKDDSESNPIVPLAEGGKESNCALTLYTIVSVDNFDRSMITADTVAVWNDKSGYGGEYNSHTYTRDAIGMTAPDGCLFEQYTLLGPSTNPHAVGGSDNSIAIEMQERNGKTTLMTIFDNVSCTGRHNWFSSYTHTWSDLFDFDFSFGVSLGQKGLVMTPIISKGSVHYWPLASWVTCSL